MAKYLTEFNTYAEYSAATLNLPNVSLIKSTGDVYYKNIYAGAVLGDILMYDVANQKLVSTIGSSWNTTMYPLASYEPIAINVYPADQASDNKSRWMALRWASNSSDTGNNAKVGMKWGLKSTTLGEYTSTDTTLLNGRENTTKALEFADGTTGNTQAAFAAFAACNRFRTSGTSAGDWYLPSKAELDLYKANYSTINSKIQTIKDASSSIVSEVNANMWMSTEGSSNENSYELYSSGIFSNQGGRSYSQNGCRAMLSL